jgi:hypothetical protein
MGSGGRGGEFCVWGLQYDGILIKYGGFVWERSFEINAGRDAQQACTLREKVREDEEQGSGQRHFYVWGKCIT